MKLKKIDHVLRWAVQRPWFTRKELIAEFGSSAAAIIDAYYGYAAPLYAPDQQFSGSGRPAYFTRFGRNVWTLTVKGILRAGLGANSLKSGNVTR